MTNLKNTLRELWLLRIENAWKDLFLVMVADSSLEEIENFHKRIIAIPSYTQEEAWSLRLEKLGIRESVTTLRALPESLIQKGSNSWKIEI